MAHDTDEDAGTEPAPAKGAEGKGAEGKGAKGKGHHPGHGILNGPHRDEILIVATVVLVAISYLTLRKLNGGGGSAPGTAPGLVSASNPTGAVAGFDQATMQGFQQMLANQSDHLAQLEATLTSDPVAPSTPSPISSPFRSTMLFGPAFTGKYVRYANGLIAEVEPDGSQLNLTGSEWAQVRAKMRNKVFVDQLSGKQQSGPNVSSVTANLNRAKPATPAPNVSIT